MVQLLLLVPEIQKLLEVLWVQSHLEAPQDLVILQNLWVQLVPEVLEVQLLL